MSNLATNKKATFNYFLLDKYEAGLVLTGHEVRSIKDGRISLKGSFISIRQGELFLVNALIFSFQPANKPTNFTPERPKKLLLQKKEIKSLISKTKEKGVTLVPLKVYLKRNKIKLEFALAKGKKKWDKREAIKQKDIKRRINRAKVYTH
ncbi:MAG TPA: SsrA-binding protein SmpB [Candidatus Portnoybacteria bacterium]|nr:SsrA-binding protein SmpB [Candidatus Portnoybacteria bacterium]